MKKYIISVFLFPICLLFFSLPAHAAVEMPIHTAENKETSVIYLENGGRIVLSPVYETNCASVAGAVNTVTRSRDVSYSSPNGTLEWKYTLTATFSYEYGVSSTCTDATYTQTIYNSAWSFSNGSASRSGDTAYGKGHYQKKELFVVLENIDVDVSISCDIYGNVK